MKARIRDITFGKEKVYAQVAFFFEESEEGYNECYREIMTIVDDVAVGTGKWRLYPFNSIGIEIKEGMTKEDFKNEVIAKLRSFKQAHTISLALKIWTGTEIEDK